jgi:FixJ family two-component response regulator
MLTTGVWISTFYSALRKMDEETSPKLWMRRIPLISVVDDDEALRSSLDSLIRSVGLRAQGFSSAEAFLESNQVRETDCLILDVRMAGMSGLELQRQMVGANSDLPIIFVTGHEDDDRRAQALDAGAVAFLYKPFREEELLNAIDAALKDS